MKVHVARAVTPGETDKELARAFLQNRISLWAFWVFVLSFGFYLRNIATWPFVPRGSARFADMMLEAGNLYHLAASLTFGIVWVFTRRRPYRSGLCACSTLAR